MGPRTKVAQSGPAPRRSSQGSSPLAPIHERPPEELKMIRLTHYPTWSPFVQRYRAVQGQGGSKDYCDAAESSVSPQDKKIDL